MNERGEQVLFEILLFVGGWTEAGQRFRSKRVVLLLIHIQVVVVRWRHEKTFAYRERIERLGFEETQFKVNVQIGPARAESAREIVGVVRARARLLIVLVLLLNDRLNVHARRLLL